MGQANARRQRAPEPRVLPGDIMVVLGGAVPFVEPRVCPACGELRDAGDFVKTFEDRPDGTWLLGGDTCQSCDKPLPLPRRPKMRLYMTDPATGRECTWRARKRDGPERNGPVVTYGPPLPISKAILRVMNPGAPVLEIRPISHLEEPRENNSGSVLPLVPGPAPTPLFTPPTVLNAKRRGRRPQYDPRKSTVPLGGSDASLAELRATTPAEVRAAEARQLEDIVLALLVALGYDTGSEGLRGTPQRVARFYQELRTRPAPRLTTFPAEGMSEMVVQHGIPFYSLCEHHMIPFFGTASVAYIPDGRIVGLSKLARVVQHEASGLQNQERITTSVAQVLEDGLKPQGVGVVLRARHLCMEMRGVAAHGVHTTTSCLRGAFLQDAKARGEFLRLANGG